MAFKFNPFTGKLDEFGPVLTGTGTVSAAADGTAALPGIAFASDLNTGIYRPGADQVAISTNGTGRLFVDASGNVGIGDTGPDSKLHITYTVGAATTEGIRLEDTTNTTISQLATTGSSFNYAGVSGHNALLYSSRDLAICADNANSGQIKFATDGGEAARIDGSKRLLVGTSSAYDVSGGSGYTPRFQLVGDTAEQSSILAARTDGSPLVVLANLGGGSVISDDEQLGAINFKGNDGNSYPDFASINAFVDGTPGDGDCPGRLVFSTTADGASSPTPRFRIDSSGRIDHFASAGTGHEIHTSTTLASDEVYRVRNGSTDLDDGTVVMKILADGDLENTNNSYGAISDIKLKENVVDATSQWGDLKSLQVRKYNFKEETGYGTHTQIGLIAQEVELVSPGLVSESPDRDEEGNNLGTVTKSVNYSVLYMKAVKALQEAMERIEVLEAKVNALEGN